MTPECILGLLSIGGIGWRSRDLLWNLAEEKEIFEELCFCWKSEGDLWGARLFMLWIKEGGRCEFALFWFSLFISSVPLYNHYNICSHSVETKTFYSYLLHAINYIIFISYNHINAYSYNIYSISLSSIFYVNNILLFLFLFLLPSISQYDLTKLHISLIK